MHGHGDINSKPCTDAFNPEYENHENNFSSNLKIYIHCTFSTKEEKKKRTVNLSKVIRQQEIRREYNYHFTREEFRENEKTFAVASDVPARTGLPQHTVERTGVDEL